VVLQFDWVVTPGMNTRFTQSILRGEGQRSAILGPENAHELETMDLNEMFTHDVVYIWSNMPLVQHLFKNPRYRQRIIYMGWTLGDDPTNAPTELKKQCTSLDKLIGVLSRAAFEPTPALQVRHVPLDGIHGSMSFSSSMSISQKEIDEFKQRHFKGPSLCLHFRFARLGASTDFTNDGIPYDIDPDWFWRCAERYRFVALVLLLPTH